MVILRMWFLCTFVPYFPFRSLNMEGVLRLVRLSLLEILGWFIIFSIQGCRSNLRLLKKRILRLNIIKLINLWLNPIKQVLLSHCSFFIRLLVVTIRILVETIIYFTHFPFLGLSLDTLDFSNIILSILRVLQRFSVCLIIVFSFLVPEIISDLLILLLLIYGISKSWTLALVQLLLGKIYWFKQLRRFV